MGSGGTPGDMVSIALADEVFSFEEGLHDAPSHGTKEAIRPDLTVWPADAHVTKPVKQGGRTSGERSES